MGCPHLSLGRSHSHLEGNVAVRVKTGDQHIRETKPRKPKPALTAQLQPSHPLLPRRAQGRRKGKGRERHPPGPPAAAGGPRMASCEGCFLSCGHVLPTLPGGRSPQSAAQERGPSTSQVTFSNLLRPETTGPSPKGLMEGSSLIPHEHGRVALPSCDPRGSPSLPQGTTDPHLLLWQMAGRRSSQKPTQARVRPHCSRGQCVPSQSPTHTHSHTHILTVRTSIIPPRPGPPFCQSPASMAKPSLLSRTPPTTTTGQGQFPNSWFLYQK